jgi:hypothetical protein
MSTDRRLVVRGEQVVDIRDFGVASPTVLMLRIYPDVEVGLQVEANLESPIGRETRRPGDGPGTDQRTDERANHGRSSSQII